MEPMAVRTVLVVEDDEPLLEAVTAKLTKAGFRVLGTRTVDQALDFLQNVGNVDAVWIDHFLPGKTGDVFVKFLRQDSRWRSLPVFLVTNSVSPDIVNKYISYGITQYYLKVVTTLETIINSIALYFQEHPASPRLPQ